jgi:hypothetical protein
MDMMRSGILRYRWRTLVGILALGLAIAFALGGCENKESTNDTVTADKDEASWMKGPVAQADENNTVVASIEPPPADAPTRAIRVTSDEATIDLGEVAPKSRHRLAFDVVNSGTKDIAIKTIRSDCSCIEAIERPSVLRAGQATRVIAVYEAPKQIIPYSTQLTIVTDSAERPFIHLWVKSRTVEEE